MEHDNDAGMSVVTRLQCARQFLVSLLPEPGTAPAPFVEDLIFKPEARDMLHDLGITVSSPEGVVVHGQLPPEPETHDVAGNSGEPPPGYASGSIQVRHMGRVICRLHASSAG